MRSRISLLMALSVVTLIPISAVAADVDGLRAAHALVLKTVESGDITDLEKRVHPRAIGFFRAGQRAVSFSRAVAEFAMTDLQAFSATTYGSEYRVVGTSGVVCSVVRLAPERSTSSKAPPPPGGRALGPPASSPKKSDPCPSHRPTRPRDRPACGDVPRAVSVSCRSVHGGHRLH